MGHYSFDYVKQRRVLTCAVYCHYHCLHIILLAYIFKPTPHSSRHFTIRLFAHPSSTLSDVRHIITLMYYTALLQYTVNIVSFAVNVPMVDHGVPTVLGEPKALGLAKVLGAV